MVTRNESVDGGGLPLPEHAARLAAEVSPRAAEHLVAELGNVLVVLGSVVDGTESEPGKRSMARLWALTNALRARAASVLALLFLVGFGVAQSGCFVGFEALDQGSADGGDATPPWPDCRPTMDPKGYCTGVSPTIDPFFAYKGQPPGQWLCAEHWSLADQSKVGCYSVPGGPELAPEYLFCCPEPTK